MRINAHAHIFNLQTVLSEESITILVGRLRAFGVHEAALPGIRSFLHDQLLRPEHLNEEALLRRLLGSIVRSPAFRSATGAAGELPLELKLLGSGADLIALEVLRAALNQLSRLLDAGGGPGTSIFEVYQALRIAMRPEIVEVADELLKPMGPDDVLVALMMDIIAAPERPRDRNNFLAQLRGTSEAAVQRPGRILPFVAVNPQRHDHRAIMERAVTELGYVGVKLYPSLGFEVGTPEIRGVLRYCVDHDLPVLMHCTRTGFFKSEQTREYSDPRHWVPLLQEFPTLRMCFAHFGGVGGFSGHDADQAVWATRILDLMRAHEHVYADISYHVDMMRGGAAEQAYLDALRALIADDALGRRVLFGTDGWLVQLSLTEDTYWTYFREALSEREFERIACEAPRAFLGLPAEDGTGMRANIARHVAFLESRRSGVGAPPAGWVGTVSQAVFTPTRTGTRWTPNNQAHVRTYQFFRSDRDTIPRVFHDLKFAGSGQLRLRQLGYWTRDRGDRALFDQARQATALAFDRFLTHNGARYEGDYDRDSAVRALDRLLDDGDRTLSEVATSVDALYLFPAEVA